MPSRLKQYNLVYLASPYTLYHDGLDAAANAVAAVAGDLRERGVCAISPIAHSHAVARAAGLDPTDHELWMELDRNLIRVCDALLVVCLPGWMTSKGVTEETKIFEQRGKPVHHLDPVTMEIAG
jgi:hypothetical protein